MPNLHVPRRKVLSCARLALVALSLSLTLLPAAGLAQTTTPQKQPVRYAVTDLNLRKGPGSGDAIIGSVPLGAAVEPVSGSVSNDYMRVTYNGRTGWVVALGLVTSPKEVDTAAPAPAPTATTDAPLTTFDSDARVTLTPLMLRSAPSIDAEPLTGMPEGSLVTLTREGAENGYVTIDYDGAQGWAYADLLARPGEVT